MANYEYRLTTVDNPFDPFTQYDAWLNYDHLHVAEHGNVYTDQLLARFARTSDELSDSEYNDEINRAITRILVLDPLNIYRRKRREVPEETETIE
jgi:hypothetical protein